VLASFSGSFGDPIKKPPGSIRTKLLSLRSVAMAVALEDDQTALHETSEGTRSAKIRKHFDECVRLGFIADDSNDERLPD
jgi:hypothetical protein